MLKYPTYSENIRMAGLTTDNRLRRPIPIRELQGATGLGYETVRGIWMGKGKLYISKLTSDQLCDYLGLPLDEMWALATKEKLEQKARDLGTVPLETVEGAAKELLAAFSGLSAVRQRALLRMAQLSLEEQQTHAT